MATKLPKKSWKWSDIFVYSTWSGIPLDCTSHHKNNYDEDWLFNYWLYKGLFKCPSVKADYLMNCSNILFFNKVTERNVTFLYVWSRYTFKLCASHHAFGCFRYSRVVRLSSCKFPQGGFIVGSRLPCIPQLLKESTVSHFCNFVTCWNHDELQWRPPVVALNGKFETNSSCEFLLQCHAERMWSFRQIVVSKYARCAMRTS